MDAIVVRYCIMNKRGFPLTTYGEFAEDDGWELAFSDEGEALEVAAEYPEATVEKYLTWRKHPDPSFFSEERAVA